MIDVDIKKILLCEYTESCTFKRAKDSKAMPWSIFFSVWFKTDIRLTNEYLLETINQSNTLYQSLFNIYFLPNTLYLCPCLLCILDTNPGLLCGLDLTTCPRLEKKQRGQVSEKNQRTESVKKN